MKGRRRKTRYRSASRKHSPPTLSSYTVSNLLDFQASLSALAIELDIKFRWLRTRRLLFSWYRTDANELFQSLEASEWNCARVRIEAETEQWSLTQKIANLVRFGSKAAFLEKKNHLSGDGTAVWWSDDLRRIAALNNKLNHFLRRPEVPFYTKDELDPSLDRLRIALGSSVTSKRLTDEERLAELSPHYAMVKMFLNNHFPDVEPTGNPDEALRRRIRRAFVSIPSLIKVREQKDELNRISDERRQLRIQENARLDEQRKAKESRKKAMAAAYVGRSRKEAETIKRVLKRQLAVSTECPYCGGVLGGNPNADHIYPVSLGGLSTLENMVYVCDGCNNKKSDLTLSRFAAKHGFDRSAIEERLQKLDKCF